MKKATLSRRVRQGRLEKNFPEAISGKLGPDYSPLLITSLTRSPTRLL
jgi:hypothetical protein